MAKGYVYFKENKRGVEVQEPTLEGIKDRCYIDETSGCWIWKTAILNEWDRLQRPIIRNNGSHVTVTRLAWELLHDKEFPRELQAGHLCEDINCLSCFCVNPEHITPVTQSENEWMKAIYSSDDEYDNYIKRAKEWGAKSRTKNKMNKEWTLEERCMAIYNNETVKTPNPNFSTPCALMHGRLKSSGYAVMDIRRESKRERIHLHRLMCFVKNKENYKSKKEDSRIVRHLCGNKNCIEPTHLEFGDNSSNAYDSYMSGTHSNTSLKPEDVRNILKDWVEVNKNWSKTTVKGNPTRHGILKAGWENCKYNITYSSFKHITTGNRWGLVYKEFKKELKELENG